MKKGWIEKAEEQQAKATEVSFALSSQSSSGSGKEDYELMEEQRALLLVQKQKKLAIFKKVLEIDPIDDVALFGLCKASCDSGKWETSLKYGVPLLKNHPKFSAAYASVAKSYLGKKDKLMALETLKKGIEVSKKQGDLMPQKQMERMLSQLDK